MQRFSRLDRLSLVAYLTLAGVTAAGLWEIDRILLRWLALGLLVGFGLLHSRLPEQDGSPRSQRLANLIIALQTGLVVVLIETTRAGFPFVLLFFILSVTVMLYNPLRPGLLWLGGFILLTGWFFFEQEGLGGGLRAMAIYAGGFLFFGVVTNALTQARLTQRQNALLLGELQAKNRQLEEYAAQVETLAVVEERNRLAREMHDTIGHRLTTAAVQLEGAQRLAPSEPERAAAMIGAGRQQVREALQDLRQTVGRLREPVEIELSLPQALHRLAASFQEATGLAIHLELPENACEVTSAQRLALYRTAQEGLTNIQRHAAAHQAWLHLECSPDQIRLQVIDDGRGLDGRQPQHRLWPARPARAGGPAGRRNHAFRPAGRRHDPDDPAPHSGRIMAMEPIRILIVDDQRLMREGLRTLLELEGDLAVAAEAEDGQAALEQYEAIQPDVVLMDIRMPRLDGVEATRRLRQRWPEARVIILTTFDDDAYVFDGLRAGALGYLLKDVSGQELAEAVRKVAAGGALIEPSVARKVLAEFSRLAEPTRPALDRLPEPLSEREQEILRLLASGANNRQIASQLFLAEGTVKNYISTILDKLGVQDRTQAALRARELGLLNPG